MGAYNTSFLLKIHTGFLLLTSTGFSPRKASLLECIYFVMSCISITVAYKLSPQDLVQIKNTDIIAETPQNMVSKISSGFQGTGDRSFSLSHFRVSFAAVPTCFTF
jgi:hypothetical protein